MKYLILQFGFLLAGISVWGQHPLSPQDSLMFKFLRQQDTTDHSEMLYTTHRWRIGKAGDVTITQFGTNRDHSADYLLFRGRGWYEIVGNDGLGNNIHQMNQLLYKRKIKMKDKLRLKCYDVFIQNEERIPDSPYLMDDPDYVKPTK